MTPRPRVSGHTSLKPSARCAHGSRLTRDAAGSPGQFGVGSGSSAAGTGTRGAWAAGVRAVGVPGAGDRAGMVTGAAAVVASTAPSTATAIRLIRTASTGRENS